MRIIINIIHTEEEFLDAVKRLNASPIVPSNRVGEYIEILFSATCYILKERGQFPPDNLEQFLHAYEHLMNNYLYNIGLDKETSLAYLMKSGKNIPLL
jgi:hypothetical protein